MAKKPFTWARLAKYDYDLDYDAHDDIWIITIQMGSPDDVDIADIASSITRNDGHIYVDGYYMEVLDICTIHADGNEYAFQLKARELNEEERIS